MTTSTPTTANIGTKLDFSSQAAIEDVVRQCIDYHISDAEWKRFDEEIEKGLELEEKLMLDMHLLEEDNEGNWNHNKIMSTSDAYSRAESKRRNKQLDFFSRFDDAAENIAKSLTAAGFPALQAADTLRSPVVFEVNGQRLEGALVYRDRESTVTTWTRLLNEAYKGLPNELLATV